MNTRHAHRRQGIGKWIRVATVAGALVWFGGGAVAGRGQAQSGSPSDDNVWQVVAERPGADVAARTAIEGPHAVVRFSKAAFDARLGLAPREGDPGATLAGVVLTLPMPDGRFARFRVVESPILAPELAAAFPEIRTYRGQGLDDPTATTRFGWTEVGFHAIILSQDGSVYIDPYAKGDLEYYVSFNKADYRKQGEKFICLVDARRGEALQRAENTFPFSNGTSLRTYRLALAANGEYTVAAGGTKALALARMTTTMNRVNGIYERELAVRMTMATGTGADSTALIYTNGATDPYTNDDGVAMLTENQTNIDTVVGAANYDIGHVFSTGGGGIASLQSPCDDSEKAQGVTGSSNPTGDAFDVDYVAHEMGHQFGGNHTFNGSASNCGGGNRSTNHAYEVGSGSTIQAYAGICSVENLQPNSHDYFHVESLDEMTAFLTSGGGSTCGTASATSNTLPTVSAGSNYTIPQSTPFTLTASGGDGNGDTLTYAWEEFDRGTVSSSVATASTDDGSRPLFRSYSPTTSSSRTFPSLTYILNNANVPPTTYACAQGSPTTCLTGEVLPSTNRTMTFQVTARDNRSGGGGIVTASMQATVTTSAGPFKVTSPNTAISVASGSTQTITWNVAGTTGAPVSTANVKISLSTDGGTTFSTVLAASTPNDGSQALAMPAASTSSARIKVEAVGNIFFDVSDTNFTILGLAAPTLVSPISNQTTTGQPTYKWQAVAGTEEYYLWVSSGGQQRIGQWFTAAAAGCGSGTGTCTVTPATALANGSVRWEVKAWSAALGHGLWSADGLFTVASSTPAALTAPTLVSPTGSTTVTTTQPAYSWNAVSGAEEYYLWVSSGGQQRIGQWFTAAAAGCGSGTGTCAVTPATALANANVRWEVKAWSQALGHGPWSADGWFTVASATPAALTAPTLVSPTGNTTVTTTQPAYSWNPVAGAEEYYLWVSNGGVQRVGEWVTAAAAGCSGGTGTCTLTPSVALTDGTVRWEVKAWSQALGHGPWSADGWFTVE